MCHESGKSRPSDYLVRRSLLTYSHKHHGRGPPEYYEPKDRELDIHILESKAYRRLKQQGLCDLGIVPTFSERWTNSTLDNACHI